MADPPNTRASCLYWDGYTYQLACPDDMCHNSDLTLCGLERNSDFDQFEDGDG